MKENDILTAICGGLRASANRKAIKDFYDERINKLKEFGMEEEAARWEKLKEAALKNN